MRTLLTHLDTTERLEHPEQAPGGHDTFTLTPVATSVKSHLTFFKTWPISRI